jgi:hypothetical protein
MSSPSWASNKARAFAPFGAVEEGLYGTGAGLAEPTSNQKAPTASTASNTVTTLRREWAAVI